MDGRDASIDLRRLGWPLGMSKDARLLRGADGGGALGGRVGGGGAKEDLFSRGGAADLPEAL